MNLYYKVWTDLLVRMKSQPQNKGSWKLYSFIFMTMAMSLNLLVIISIIQKHVLNAYFYNIQFVSSPIEKLDAALKYVVLFFIPPALLNYYFVFYKKKYQKIIGRQKESSGKLAATYLLLSYFSPIILLLLAYGINQIW